MHLRYATSPTLIARRFRLKLMVIAFWPGFGIFGFFEFFEIPDFILIPSRSSETESEITSQDLFPNVSSSYLELLIILVLPIRRFQTQTSAVVTADGVWNSANFAFSICLFLIKN